MMPNEISKQPRVSIGVFLYNEDRFVHASLEALLAQDYPNLEIIISDNCSTDETFTICKAMTAGDSRVKLSRQSMNVGVTENSAAVLAAATGKYFMWASGHDLWSTNIISACVEALEVNPAAVLAYPSSKWIDAEGEPLERVSSTYDTRGMDLISRFFIVFWGNAHPVVGVIKTDALREIPQLLGCAGSDQIVLAELAIKGDFLHVPTATWCRREFRSEQSHSDKVNRYRSAEFNLTGSWFNRMFPLVRLPVELLRTVARAPLKLVDKIIVLIALPGAFAARFVAGKQANRTAASRCR